MSRYARAALLLIGFLLTHQASATIVDVIASKDTFVTQHNGLGGVNSQHGNDEILYVIGTQNTGFISTSLVQFDLTGNQNDSVVGDGELLLYLTSAWTGANITVSAFGSTTEWDENSTWNTIPGGPLPFGTFQDSQILNFTAQGEGYYGFDVSQSLIQSWIDNPTGNLGLAITSGNSDLGHSDIIFASSENQNGFGPRLVFNVPAPAGILLLLPGLLLLKRRASKAAINA